MREMHVAGLQRRLGSAVAIFPLGKSGTAVSRIGSSALARVAVLSRLTLTVVLRWPLLAVSDGSHLAVAGVQAAAAADAATKTHFLPYTSVIFWLLA